MHQYDDGGRMRTFKKQTSQNEYNFTLILEQIGCASSEGKGDVWGGVINPLVLKNLTLTLYFELKGVEPDSWHTAIAATGPFPAATRSRLSNE